MRVWSGFVQRGCVVKVGGGSPPSRSHTRPPARQSTGKPRRATTTAEPPEAGRLRAEQRQEACLAADCEDYGARYCERRGGCSSSQASFYEAPASRCPKGVW